MPTHLDPLQFTLLESVHLILRDVSRVPNVIGNGSAGIGRVFTWMETRGHSCVRGRTQDPRGS